MNTGDRNTKGRAITKYLIRQRAVKRIVWIGCKRITRVTDVTIAK